MPLVLLLLYLASPLVPNIPIPLSARKRKPLRLH
jgi:hypothetical protein